MRICDSDMCHSVAMGSAQSEMAARACAYKRAACWMVSSRCDSSSRERTVAGCEERSVHNNAAARATRISLLTIDTALTRRDLCDRARAAARMSANSAQSAAIWNKIVELSGGRRGAVMLNKARTRRRRFTCGRIQGEYKPRPLPWTAVPEDPRARRWRRYAPYCSAKSPHEQRFARTEGGSSSK